MLIYCVGCFLPDKVLACCNGTEWRKTLTEAEETALRSATELRTRGCFIDAAAAVADLPHCEKVQFEKVRLNRAMGRCSEADRLLAEIVLSGGADEVTMVEYARLCRARGLYRDAERLLLVVIELDDKAPASSEHAIPLLELGRLYRELGRYSEAEVLLVRGRNITDQMLGRDHVQTFAALFELARLYRVQGRRSEAADLLLRVMKFDEAHWPDGLPAGIALIEGVHLALDSGDVEQAAFRLERAAHIVPRSWNEFHPRWKEFADARSRVAHAVSTTR
jgi:tetratricopeptide (TPR) repeat protein